MQQQKKPRNLLVWIAVGLVLFVATLSVMGAVATIF